VPHRNVVGGVARAEPVVETPTEHRCTRDRYADRIETIGISIGTGAVGLAAICTRRDASEAEDDAADERMDVPGVIDVDDLASRDFMPLANSRIDDDAARRSPFDAPLEHVAVGPVNGCGRAAPRKARNQKP
jgi:hypothetical protein